MKAIVISDSEKCSVEDVVSAPLKNHEVRVKVKVTCVCGSDLKNFKKPVQIPQIPGHEFSGVVTEIGPNSDGKIKIGERITAFPMMACLKCEACQSGRLRDCEKKLSLGFHLPGSFAEEVVIDERFAIPLIPSITFEQGALVEHICCGHRLSKEVKTHQSNRSAHIVVIGDGPIGLADIQALRAAGYNNITLLGKHDFRMSLALKLGATRAIKKWDSSLPKIDVCIHAALAPETMEALANSMNTDAIIFPQTSLAKKYPQFKSGRAFAYSLSDFEEVMSLIENKTYKTDELITQRVSLEKFPEVLPTLFQKNNQFKTVLVLEEEQ